MMESVIYMSIRETAKKTGLAEPFIRAAVKENKVPGFFPGRSSL